MSAVEVYDQDQRFRAIAEWFERLVPETLDEIDLVYASSARFIDPFNDLSGRDNIERVFAHMFETLDSPRFKVTSIAAHQTIGFMTWDFLFVRRGREQKIFGCTQFEINDRGLIVLHRDFWDPAAQVYEQVPVLGTILRLLRRKLALPKS